MQQIEGSIVRHLLRLALFAPCLLAQSANAATSTSSFQAKVTIAAQCLINSASILDFGSNGVIAANLDLTSTISVTCTNLASYNIGLDKGLNGASVTTRKMKNTGNAETINYSLFSNAGRTTNWGVTIGTDTLGATGNGAAQLFTVYGRVPAQTTPSPGNYSDTITLTVTY